MYRSIRGIIPASAAVLWLATLGAAGAQAQISCEFSSLTEKTIRAQSLAGLLPDIEVACSGGAAGDISLMLFISADVLTLPGQPPAYLLVGASDGDTVDVGATGIPATFDAFSGRNPIWTNVAYVPPADGEEPFRLRVVNLWIDPQSAPPSGIIDVGAQLNGPPGSRATNLQAIATATLDDATLRLTSGPFGGGRATVSMFEDYVGALAPAAPTDATLVPMPQNVLGATYRSESGYISDPAAGARTATRLLVRMTPHPDVSSLAFPGRVSLLPGGGELRLVSDATAPELADGSLAIAEDTAFHTAEPDEDGGFSALYEFVPISGYHPATQFAATWQIILGCDVGADGPWDGNLFFAPFAPAPAAGLSGERAQTVEAAPLPVFADSPVAGFSIDLASACAPPEAPLFSSSAVVNAASFRQPLAPGVMATVFPANLVAASNVAPSVPLPVEMDGIQVLVNEVPAPLFFTSGPQINFQVPWSALPGNTLTASEGRRQEQQFVGIEIVRDGVTGDAVRIPIERYSPAIVTLDFGPGRALAVNPDATIAQRADRSPIPARPAVAGEILMLFATGLGSAAPAPVDGDDSTTAEGDFVERMLLETPTVRIGGADATVHWAGMSPQFVGVAQLNVEVPAGVSGDEVSLEVLVGGQRSREDVTIAVQ